MNFNLNTIYNHCVACGVLIMILRWKRYSPKSHTFAVNRIIRFVNVANTMRKMETMKGMRMKKKYSAYGQTFPVTRNWFAAHAQVRVTHPVYSKRSILIFTICYFLHRHSWILQMEWWTIWMLQILSTDANRIGNMLCAEFNACRQVNCFDLDIGPW